MRYNPAIMQEQGAIVALARGLAVRVSGSGLGELASWGMGDASQPVEACVASLRLEQLTSGLVVPVGDLAFRADLQWQDATTGHFSVPGGRGTLRVDEASQRLAVDLGYAPDALQIAAETTLRLLLSLLLPPVGGLLIHASAVALEGKAHIFLGHSGAGKTTTARRLGAEGAEVLAEDLLILRQDSDGKVLAEACRFDVAGARVRCAHAEPSWPVEAGYLVRKGAARSELLGRTPAPVRSWSEALFSPRMLGRSSIALMEALAYAASHVPLFEFAAAPDGVLTPAIGEEGRRQ